MSSFLTTNSAKIFAIEMQTRNVQTYLDPNAVYHEISYFILKNHTCEIIRIDFGTL